MTDVAAGGSETPRASKPSAAPLDDMMLAMDVVDTLRHRHDLVTQELRSGERDGALFARLRSIYAAQGIAVTDEILQQGVEALRDERFVYKPPPKSAATRWATIYVQRGRWLRRFAVVVVLLAAVIWAWFATVVAPQRALPNDIEAATAAVLSISDEAIADRRAEALNAAAGAALDRGDEAEARSVLEELRSLEAQLLLTYTLQISQSGDTGFWRIPDVNETARNYYIVVEAVDADGDPVAVPVRNAESGEIRTVDRWALRVDEATFERIRADKLDDGIVQDRIFGEKAQGRLEPDYRMPTTGEAVTQW